jgi:hypothetical protein
MTDECELCDRICRYCGAEIMLVGVRWFKRRVADVTACAPGAPTMTCIIPLPRLRLSGRNAGGDLLRRSAVRPATGRPRPGPAWCWLTSSGLAVTGQRYAPTRPALARLAHIRAV